MINIGLKILEDLEAAGYRICDSDGDFSDRDVARVSEIFNRDSGFNEMLAIIDALLNIPDFEDYEPSAECLDRRNKIQIRANEVLVKYGGEDKYK